MESIYTKALIEQGYAAYSEITYIGGNPNYPAPGCVKPENVGKTSEYLTTVDPFTKTKSGYEQLFTLKNWLYANHLALWVNSKLITAAGKGSTPDLHAWDLERIEWCFGELEDK